MEELDYDVTTRRGNWRTIPNQGAERVRNAGTIEFVDASGGTRRIVRGDVKVSAFGFCGIVERMIVWEIETNYAPTTAFTRECSWQRPALNTTIVVRRSACGRSHARATANASITSI